VFTHQASWSDHRGTGDYRICSTGCESALSTEAREGQQRVIPSWCVRASQHGSLGTSAHIWPRHVLIMAKLPEGIPSDCEKCGYRPRRSDVSLVLPEFTGNELMYHVRCYNCGLEWVD
jgi:hypothetical protein